MFRFEPRPYQQEVFNQTKDMDACAYFLEQGLGKTKITLDVISHLYQERGLECVVVVSHAAVAANWVFEEITRHLWEDIPYELHLWNSTSKTTYCDIHVMAQVRTKKLKILCINKEAIRLKRAYDLVEQLLVQNTSMLVVDESTLMKNSKAKTSKKLEELGQLANYRRILSGQPSPNGPDDLYQQYRFLSPDILEVENLPHYQRRYCHIVQQYIGKRVIIKSTKLNPHSEFRQRIEPCTVRIRKESVLKDLPPKVYKTEWVQLDPKIRELYNRVRDEQTAALLGTIGQDQYVSATNVLAALVRLQQIASGFVVDERNECHTIPHPNEKLNRLVQLIEDSPGQPIVWGRFRWSIDLIAERLEKEGIKYEKLYGGLKQQEREQVLQSFRQGNSKVLIANAQSAGWGLTLVNSDTHIYYENSYNLEERLQSEDRSHRIGQKAESVLYVDLAAKDTVDETILEVLQEKEKIYTKFIAEDIKRWLR